MLPDFPQIKSRVLRALNSEARTATPRDSLLSQVRHIRQPEGNRFGDGISEEHAYDHAEAKFNIDRLELIRDGIAVFRAHIPRSVADLTDQIEKSFFMVIRTAVQKNGNEVRVKGKKLMPEDLIALLEKGGVSFDNNGRPIWQTLAVHPDAYEDTQACMVRLTSEPVYRKQLEALLEKKRAEWNSRESSRRLVD
jgi:hypothetical protein